MTNIVTIGKLMLALAMVESGNRNLPAYSDVNGKAFGYYAFHKARWVECGGNTSTFGHACKSEQDAVMLVAITRYLHKCPKGVDEVRWVATSHNIGHGVDKETKYVAKVRAAVRQL